MLHTTANKSEPEMEVPPRLMKVFIDFPLYSIGKRTAHRPDVRNLTWHPQAGATTGSR
jgi:hypothetical protein